MYIGISGRDGGVFETLDQGATWRALNRGSLALFLPEPSPEYGQDPHCVRLHPLAPDVLYQQSHCGIYRIERPAALWERIGENMPKEVGDIGFPIVLHPRDPRTVWVFPMDGTDVWPRTSPDGKPAVYVTRDAGRSWQRQDRGLPASQAWFTVRRQAMTADAHDPVGVYFGTTGGEVWGEHGRGRAVARARAPPAADPRRRGRGAGVVKVWIPTPLLSYTGQRKQVEAEGATLAELFVDLDRRFPGIRFRVIDEQDGLRPHMRLFVNREDVRRLDVPLGAADEVHIFQALSGG